MYRDTYIYTYIFNYEPMAVNKAVFSSCLNSFCTVQNYFFYCKHDFKYDIMTYIQFCTPSEATSTLMHFSFKAFLLHFSLVSILLQSFPTP